MWGFPHPFFIIRKGGRMEILIIIALVAVLIGIWVVATQRKLVMMDGNIDNAMNQIGIQISSRLDALIGLLELVDSYMVQDTSLWLGKVKSNRKEIHAKSYTREVIEQEMLIAEVLIFIDAAANQYPDIKADKNFIKRMGTVDTYSRMLHTSHLIYNDSVTKLNQFIRMFPNKWIAGILGFQRREYFDCIY